MALCTYIEYALWEIHEWRIHVSEIHVWRIRVCSMWLSTFIYLSHFYCKGDQLEIHTKFSVKVPLFDIEVTLLFNYLCVHLFVIQAVPCLRIITVTCEALNNQLHQQYWVTSVMVS